jgi:hypothetical protein
MSERKRRGFIAFSPAVIVVVKLLFELAGLSQEWT